MNFGQLRSSAPRWQVFLFRLRRLTLIVLHDLRCSLHWYLVGCRRIRRLDTSAVAGSHQWCFIVGCNNSGTSLLQRVLEASGEVSTLPYEGQLYTRVLARAMRRGYERVYMEYADELRMDADAETGAKMLPGCYMTGPGSGVSRPAYHSGEDASQRVTHVVAAESISRL